MRHKKILSAWGSYPLVKLHFFRILATFKHFDLKINQKIAPIFSEYNLACVGLLAVFLIVLLIVCRIISKELALGAAKIKNGKRMLENGYKKLNFYDNFIFRIFASKKIDRGWTQYNDGRVMLEKGEKKYKFWIRIYKFLRALFALCAVAESSLCAILVYLYLVDFGLWMALAVSCAIIVFVLINFILWILFKSAV